MVRSDETSLPIMSRLSGAKYWLKAVQGSKDASRISFCPTNWSWWELVIIIDRADMLHISSLLFFSLGGGGLVVHCCTLSLGYLGAETGYRVGTPYRRL